MSRHPARQAGAAGVTEDCGGPLQPRLDQCKLGGLFCLWARQPHQKNGNKFARSFGDEATRNYIPLTLYCPYHLILTFQLPSWDWIQPLTINGMLTNKRATLSLTSYSASYPYKKAPFHSLQKKEGEENNKRRKGTETQHSKTGMGGVGSWLHK